MASASPAAAETIWNLDLHHAPTNAAPGGQVEYWIDVENTGPTDSTGTTTLEVVLPAGLSRSSIRKARSNDPVDWLCPGVAGDATVTCTTNDPVPRLDFSGSLALIADVDPGLPAGIDRFARAQVSGGGAAAPSPLVFEQTHISPLEAEFGIMPETFLPQFTEADGLTEVKRAGARPDLLRVPFDFHTVDAPAVDNPFRKHGAEPIRNLTVDLPPGFVGDPTAVGECAAAQALAADCPASSQVGLAYAKTTTLEGTPAPERSFTNWLRPINNVIPRRGSLADFAFVIAGNPIHIIAELDPERGYAVATTASDINETLPVFHQRVTFWGVPAAPRHDPSRCTDDFSATHDTSGECPSPLAPKPFLTTPPRCDGPSSLRLHSYDSWEDPGDFGPALEHDLGSFTDCEAVPFEPTVSVAPSTDAADSPTGLDVAISLPTHDSCDPGPPLTCETATAQLKDATVTLPEGLTVNAASANGLAACAPAQISLGTDDPVRCPNGSKIANVEVQTPVLPDPVSGVVYLATPHENPFNSLLAGYIVLEDPDRGLLVKIPGKITADPDTGRLAGTFNDNPQLPFSEFELHFKGGAHSTLTTPPTCGTYTSQASFAPWSGTEAVEPTSDFSITRAPGGGECPATEAALAHDPGADIGPVTPIAGRHSPFVLNLSRADGSQRFSTITLKPPPGLTAKLAGTPYCPEAALAAAASRDGAQEKANPSCPAASAIGKVYAAAGSGPDPYWTEGVAYLSGPYKGAPLSMAIVTPALAGPFDLGVVVIRTALHVDPLTAQITAVSDPIPELLEGIPLNVRRAAVVLDKPEFTLNPTSCSEKQVEGELLSTAGETADLTERFQLGECRRLGFKPRLFLRLYGKRFTRSANPRLRAVLVPRAGDANISFASVRMPNSIFLDQSHIRTVCTRAQFATDTCPKAAIYGRAAAATPLLDDPLRGPVYLRSSENLLPDLVADLRGQVRVEAVGRTDSVKGALRNTFDVVPDAPVTKFVLNLQAGNKSLLVASRNLCAGPQRALLLFRAHNGRAQLARQRINIPRCRKIHRKQQARRKAKRRAAKRGAGRASVSARRAVR